MKIYEIMDEELDRKVGVLLYYEKEKNFVIELQEDLDEWTAPFLLLNYVKKKIYTIPREISFLWVKERIIPPSRQNIDALLRNHNLRKYDEMKFLELSGGRCSQDSLYIRKISSLPEFVLERQKHNLTECCVLPGNMLLCFFFDKTVRKADLSKLTEIPDIIKVLKNEAVLGTAKVGTGGYFVTFNNSIDIPAEQLYQNGKKTGLSSEEIIAFIEHELLDTTEACDVLQCSRQNLSYMVKQGFLSPVKEHIKGSLYLKGNVLKNLW